MSEETKAAEVKSDWEPFAKAVLALASQFKMIGLSLGMIEVVDGTEGKQIKTNAVAVLPVVPAGKEGGKDFRRLAQGFSFQLQDAVFREAELKYEAAAKAAPVEESADGAATP